MKRRNLFKGAAAAIGGAALPVANQARRVFYVKLPDGATPKVINKLMDAFKSAL